MVTGPVCRNPIPFLAATLAIPPRRDAPRDRMFSRYGVFTIRSSVTIDAAIGADWNQYDPVARTCEAALRALSEPSRADIGWPLAMHLPQDDRSGSTPTTAQLQSRASLKPARTSSTIRSAPVLSQSSRALRA